MRFIFINFTFILFFWFVLLINLVKKNNLSLLIITHDINLANKLGYEIVYLRDGRVVFHGSNQAFFEEQNLQSIFGDAIVKQNDFYRVNL